MTDYIRLFVECSSCNTTSIVSARSSSGIACQHCGAPLPHASVEIIEGYVYVLSNTAMPGLLKIGYTTNQVRERVQQLNSATGVPQPFVIDAFFESETPHEDERKVHRLLAPHRTNDRREFFRIDTMLALVAIGDVMDRPPSFLRPELTERHRALTITRSTEQPPPPHAAPPPSPRRTRSEGNLIRQLNLALRILAVGRSAEEVQLAREQIRRLIPEATSLEEALSPAEWLVDESPPQV